MKDGRMFWADRIAEQVEQRVERTPELQKVVKERGYICYDEKTPSGRIHIGSGRGWVIHDTVARALRDRGLLGRFVLSADDMDPMDDLPKDLADPDYWAQFMGKPFREIPSPEKGFGSFAEYYFAEATRMFPDYGIEADLESTGERYQRGDFNQTIKIALDNADLIKEIFGRFYETSTMDQKLPFNPVCEQCGKIGTTRAYKWDAEQELLHYRCEPELVTWATGCGHVGVIRPYDGAGKFPWKVEWAAKWPTVGVTYETAGKDHFSAGGSRDVSMAISQEVFGYAPPFPSSSKKTDKGWTYKRGEAYEFFLVSGAKMSSSKGQGFPFSDMTQYAPGNILKFLLVRTRPKTAINFEPQSDLERVYRDFDDTQQKYYQALADTQLLKKDKYFNAKRLYELSHVGKILPSQPPTVDFSFGVMLVQLTGNTDEAIEALQEKGKLPADLSPEHRQVVADRLTFFRHWVNDLAPPEVLIELRTPEDLNLSSEEQSICESFVQVVRATQTERELVNSFKQIMAEHAIKAPEMYQVLYKVLFGSDQGPRLSSYILFAGTHKVASHVEQVLARN